ncbi:DUF4349 domain-containing protein [Litorimonas sp. RW-G-Af-16]|uniref:DUF4349 domain-containing protein n=1 Tax=Litorimonas sp. RW-G-Af-16 TaxID=3241168 RepID=UPI00390CC55D
MRIFLLGLAALAITACGSSDRMQSTESPMMAPPPSAKIMGSEADMEYMGDAPAPAPQASENPSAQSFLAYRYGYGFALPAKAVSPTMNAHAKTCLDAGPSKCQILNSSTNQQNESQVYASLSLRGEPTWLKTFAQDMQTSVEDASGELTSSTVSAEDLTRQILDTDARLRAQTTLRDRLQKLLETRNAELSDLLAVERELARVQGQIESATTTLNVLRKRVSMSVADISYQSQSVAVSRTAFTPLTQSLKGFVGTVAYALSDVIDFFAAILPWLLLVILPGLWLVRWFWRRRKKA